MIRQRFRQNRAENGHEEGKAGRFTKEVLLVSRNLRGASYLPFFVALGLLLLLALCLPAPLSAHGGSLPRVSDVEAGPYRLFVWAEPVPALEGEVNFTVAVTEIPAQKDAQALPVLEADVQISLERVDGTGRTLAGQATHAEAINKLMYETYIDVPTAGVWRTTVTVDSPLGLAETSFEFDVLPGPGMDWTWPTVGALGLVILIVAVRFFRRPASSSSSSVGASGRPGQKRRKRV